MITLAFVIVVFQIRISVLAVPSPLAAPPSFLPINVANTSLSIPSPSKCVPRPHLHLKPTAKTRPTSRLHPDPYTLQPHPSSSAITFYHYGHTISSSSAQFSISLALNDTAMTHAHDAAKPVEGFNVQSDFGVCLCVSAGGYVVRVPSSLQKSCLLGQGK